MGKSFLDRLTQGPLLVDGGYYLELERRCIGSRARGIPLAVLEHSDGVLELHQEFARAGADVIQAMTWGARRVELEAEVHRTAVQIARQAAGSGRFVAGTISPYTPPRFNWRSMTAEERLSAQRFFEARVSYQAEAGVDLFIVETFYSVEEIALTIPLIKEVGVPAVVTMTYKEIEFTREGYSPSEAAKRIEGLGADVVGINCQRPWQTTSHLVRQVREAVSVPVCSQPTAYELEPGEVFNRVLGRGSMYGQVEPRVVTRFAMAEYALEAQSIGVGLIGSCCGSLPFHVRAMAEALEKQVGLPDVDRGYGTQRSD